MKTSRLLLLISLIPLIALGQSSSSPTVVLKWAPVATLADGSPIPSTISVAYNIYGGHSSTGPWLLAATVQTAGSVRSNVAIGQDCYYVTAVIGARESLPSTVACIVVTDPNASIPGKPAGLTATQQ